MLLCFFFRIRLCDFTQSERFPDSNSQVSFGKRTFSTYFLFLLFNHNFFTKSYIIEKSNCLSSVLLRVLFELFQWLSDWSFSGLLVVLHSIFHHVLKSILCLFFSIFHSATRVVFLKCISDYSLKSYKSGYQT